MSAESISLAIVAEYLQAHGYQKTLHMLETEAEEVLLEDPPKLANNIGIALQFSDNQKLDDKMKSCLEVLVKDTLDKTNIRARMRSKTSFPSLQLANPPPALPLRHSNVSLDGDESFSVETIAFDNISDHGTASAMTLCYSALMPSPLTPEEANPIRLLLFGPGSNSEFPKSWIGKGFMFNTNSDLSYGLIQTESGPCGLLAALQAHIIKNLLFITKKSIKYITKLIQGQQIETLERRFK